VSPCVIGETGVFASLPKRFQAKHALGLDPGVDTGSRKENASKQDIKSLGSDLIGTEALAL
jgi:hypothetical protein